MPMYSLMPRRRSFLCAILAASLVAPTIRFAPAVRFAPTVRGTAPSNAPTGFPFATAFADPEEPVNEGPINEGPVKEEAQGPYKVAVKRVVEEPLRPSDYARGYDTRLAAFVGYEGPKPWWWGQYGADVGSGEEYGLIMPVDNPRDRVKANAFAPEGFGVSFNRQSQCYVVRFLIDTENLPPSDHPVLFKAIIKPWVREKNGQIVRMAAPLSYAVREPGKEKPVPDISRDPQLKIEKVEIKTLDKPDENGIDTEVDVTFVGDDEKPMPEGDLVTYGENVGIMDADGQRLIDVLISTGPLMMVDEENDPGGKEGEPEVGRHYVAHYGLNVRECESSTIILWSYVTRGAWPLAFTIPIRDGKNGLEIPRPGTRVVEPTLVPYPRQVPSENDWYLTFAY